jgi:hypothetical protein
MSMIDITCYKGTKEGDWQSFPLDPNMTLAEARTFLTRERFLPPEDESTHYRFVSPGKTTPKDLEEDRGLVLTGLEEYLPIRSILGFGRQFILTNIRAYPKSDLVGIGSDWFFNRYLGVRISLNDEDPTAKEINDRIRAFKPMMLTHVRPTSENVVGLFDNVCVCVENSAVRFDVSSWGAAGYQFHIAPQSGEPIGEGLYITMGDSPGRYAATSLRRYESKPQTILITGADSAGISSSEVIRFQKVIVKSRRITSYKQGGRTYASSLMPPVLTAARSGISARSAVLAGAANPAGDFERMRSLATAGPLGIVPGDSIKPGGPVVGPGSGQGFGGGISDVQTDDWTQALGEVVIFFFVFRSWEAANRVINGYNAPDPNLWN